MWGRCLRHTLGMTRRLLNLLTWLSLLMFLATVIMSARAVHTWDVFHVQTPGHVLFLSVGRAHAMVGGWSRAERDPAPHGFLRHQSLTPADRQKHWQAFVAPYLLWQFAGFYSAHDPVDDPKSKVVLGVPVWLPLAVFAAAPAARAVAGARLRRRNARIRRGLCPACAYDLRATPGQCPECGDGNQGLTA